MAVYAATATLDRPTAEKLGPRVGWLSGTVDITNYNTTLGQVTAITGAFLTTPRVVCDGLSDNGYIVQWNNTNGSFKCFYTTDDINTAGSALEVQEDVDVGVVNFHAIGLV